jgi:hypothetical protein
VEGSPKAKHAAKIEKGEDEGGKSQDARGKRMLRTEGEDTNGQEGGKI